MDQFKRAHVIMLPTETKYNNNIVKYLKEDSPFIKEKVYNKLSILDIPNPFSVKDYQPQHLYIISDEEIKEGDWCIILSNGIFHNTITQNIHGAIGSTIGTQEYLEKECKKIIATTDTSLKLKCNRCDDTKELDTGMFGIVDCNECYYKNENKHLQLPQPSQQFIEKYIESYNTGEVITDVLVEYENYTNIDCKMHIDNSATETITKQQNLKVNPKDNTITIKKIKDSWNREEVTLLLSNILHNNDIYIERFPDGTVWEVNKKDFNNWINQNL